ncbi:hypothetical protein PLCT1_00443 [Planctomycetaceae bacterium]|nr:hypothetical protein PLCT1_00443 [Planctomycetaceae bacterium]
MVYAFHMPYGATSVSTSGLETWLDRHIAHHWRVELITACFTLLFAFASTILALGLLFNWMRPGVDFVWLIPLGLALVFLTYPFVTPKPLPFLGRLRNNQEQDPARSCRPFAVHEYFADGYIAMGAVYWAPLFFHMAFEEFRKAFAIRMLDRRSVLASMRLLAERDSRVMWYEFERALPSLPLEALQRQLSLVEGVVFLKNEPPGATLTDSLREEIRAAL